MKKRFFIPVLLASAVMCSAAETGTMELTASKDTFGRSNKRNCNSGAAPFLLLAPMSGIRSLAAFDLSSVTNEIEAAEFSFCIQEDSSVPLSLTVAPMVYNPENAGWMEGRGNLGVLGRNAMVGEATFGWRSYRDDLWMGRDGRTVQDLMDKNLWEAPLAKLKPQEWTAGEWVAVPIEDAAFLETIRKEDVKTVTFGLWGTSGNGIYKIGSRESASPARLVLTVKLPEAAAPIGR